MSPQAQLILEYALVFGVALVTLGVMIVRGALRERALALGPDRDLGLDRFFYAAGAGAVLCYSALMLGLGGLGSMGIALVLELFGFMLIGLLINQSLQADAGLRKIGIAPRWPVRDLAWAAAAIPICIALAGAAGIITFELSELVGFRTEEIGHDTLKELVEDDSRTKLINVIIGAVILAPLKEEPIFRGILQTCLLRLFGERRWPALLVTAAVFSVVHAWVVPWQNLVPLFVLGLVFGYLYERTGSLLVPILVHAGFNAFNIFLAVMVHG